MGRTRWTHSVVDMDGKKGVTKVLFRFETKEFVEDTLPSVAMEIIETADEMPTDSEPKSTKGSAFVKFTVLDGDQKKDVLAFKVSRAGDFHLKSSGFGQIETDGRITVLCGGDLKIEAAGTNTLEMTAFKASLTSQDISLDSKTNMALKAIAALDIQAAAIALKAGSLSMGPAGGSPGVSVSNGITKLGGPGATQGLITLAGFQAWVAKLIAQTAPLSNGGGPIGISAVIPPALPSYATTKTKAE